MAEGEGRSKKEAEQQAAKEAYFCLKKDGKGL
jgi:dsRNA-specific ribonuclease